MKRISSFLALEEPLGGELSGDPSVARSCVLPPLGAQWTWWVDVGVSGSYAAVVAVYFSHLR